MNIGLLPVGEPLLATRAAEDVLRDLLHAHVPRLRARARCRRLGLRLGELARGLLQAHAEAGEHDLDVLGLAEVVGGGVVLEAVAVVGAEHLGAELALLRVGLVFEVLCGKFRLKVDIA